MDEVVVNDRIMKKHKNISKEDVLSAWNNCFIAKPRLDRPHEYIALGPDSSGRLIEMVAVRTKEMSWHIYHAFTPPTPRMLEELTGSRG